MSHNLSPYVCCKVFAVSEKSVSQQSFMIQQSVSSRLDNCQALVPSPVPPNPSRWSVGPGQRDQEHRVVQHVQGEGYQPPITSRTGSSQVFKGLRMTPPNHPG